MESTELLYPTSFRAVSAAINICITVICWPQCFWLCHSAYGILISQPEMGPCRVQWKQGALTTGPPGKSPPAAIDTFSSVQFSSVAQSCPTLCDPMNHSTPGLPVHHQLPESTQTHVHRVGDAIQPFYPRSSPSLPALNLSQHQGLFK